MSDFRGDVQPRGDRVACNLLLQVFLALRNAELYDGMVQMNEYNDNILRR